MERVIFLVDMNAFFISCEMSVNPALKGKPAAVAGDPKNRSGIILAANYDARKYGVKTTMLLHEAKRLCPGLVLVPPTRGLYEARSHDVMQTLRRYSPLIQQNSIDEAWMDLTGCESLFGKPREIARKIMRDINGELDLWCSIGISENKFLSKMASEMKKPQGITEVWIKDVPSKIWTLPVREMYGIGKQTEKKLLDMAIYTIGDIARCDVRILSKTFGKFGDELHRLANGTDPSPVTEHPQHESRSISRSTTLSKDIDEIEYAKTVLMRLSEEVGMEARSCGLKGKTVSIVIKYGDFQTITRQKSVRPTYLTKEIYQTGVKLLTDNWNPKRPVRLLGIGLGNIDENPVEQISIFDMEVQAENGGNKEEKLEKALDTIREKYGTDKIKRAKIIRYGNTGM